MIDVNTLVCPRCSWPNLPGADLCTCTAWLNPKVRQVMQTVVDERHRAACARWSSRQPRLEVGKVAA